MAAQRLSRRQKQILQWLAADHQRTRGMIRSSHQDLVQALPGDKGNISHSLQTLEARDLIVIGRSPGGKAEARKKQRKNQPLAWFHHRNYPFSSLSLRFQGKQHVSDAFRDPPAAVQAYPQRTARIEPQAFLLGANEFHETLRGQRRLRLPSEAGALGRRPCLRAAVLRSRAQGRSA